MANVFRAVCSGFIGILLLCLQRGMGQAMRNLTCYDCMESWPDLYVPFTACESNLSAVRQMVCHPLDQYCEVTVTSKHGVKDSLKRSCATSCEWGCKLTEYGVTIMTCRTCCQSNLCNTGNAAPPIRPLPPAPLLLGWGFLVPLLLSGHHYPLRWL